MKTYFLPQYRSTCAIEIHVRFLNVESARKINDLQKGAVCCGSDSIFHPEFIRSTIIGTNNTGRGLMTENSSLPGVGRSIVIVANYARRVCIHGKADSCVYITENSIQHHKSENRLPEPQRDDQLYAIHECLYCSPSIHSCISIKCKSDILGIKNLTFYHVEQFFILYQEFVKEYL